MKKIAIALVLLATLSVQAATTQINVLGFGAKGDGVTDDTVAFQRAITFARTNRGAIYAPSPTVGYVVSSIDLSGVSMLYGDGGVYGYGTPIIHKLGATDDMFVFRDSPNFRPVLRDLYLQGRKEQNFRNDRAISAVASRYEFTVASAPPAAIVNGQCFFYAPNGGYYRYIGSGVISNITGNVVQLYNFRDWFATEVGAGSKLLTGYKVCFPQVVTENGVTGVDPTRAGYSAVTIENSGAYLKLQNVRFSSWHCAIRRGAGLGISAFEVFASKSSLSGYYCPFAAGSDDVVMSFYSPGYYETQDNLPADTLNLTDSGYRRTVYGMSFSGTLPVVQMAQVYGHINNFRAYFAIPISVGLLNTDSPLLQDTVIENASVVMMNQYKSRVGTQLADATYPFLEVGYNCRLDIQQVDTSLVNGTNRASALVQSMNPSSRTTLGSITQGDGYAALEAPYQAGITGLLRYNDLTNTVVRTPAVGGTNINSFLVNWEQVSQVGRYGLRTIGDGSTANPYRQSIVASDYEVASVNPNGKWNLGATNNHYYRLTLGNQAGETLALYAQGSNALYGFTMLYDSASADYRIGTFVNGDERVSVLRNGNVGIGITNTPHKLSLGTVVGNALSIWELPGGGNTYGLQMLYDGSTFYRTALFANGHEGPHLRSDGLFFMDTAYAATLNATNLNVTGTLVANALSLSSLSTATLTITTNLIYGTTNAVPANTNAVLWLPVVVGGVTGSIPWMANP